MDNKKLRNNVHKRLKKIESCLGDKRKCEAKDQFLEKFMVCETICKRILDAYYTSKGKKKAMRDIKLNLTDIKAAMKYAGYIITDNALLGDVFSSEDKRGSKSAKSLRNGIVHSLQIEDINEVFNRHSFLMLRMDAYLQLIKAPVDNKKKPNMKKNSIMNNNATTSDAA